MRRCKDEVRCLLTLPLLAVLWGCSAHARRNSSPVSGAIAADDLLSAYQSAYPSVNADAKYKGKTLTVTGAVVGKGRPIGSTDRAGGRYVINLDGGGGSVPCVVCLFDSSQGKFTEAAVGRNITVRGLCIGTPDSPGPSYPYLTHCKILAFK